MQEPNHVRQFQDADPLAVSGYVAQAAKRALTSRAPPDAHLAETSTKSSSRLGPANPTSPRHPGR